MADRFSEVVIALALISATILFALSLTLVAARLRRDRRELRQRAARAAVTTALQERGEPLQAVIAAAVRHRRARGDLVVLVRDMRSAADIIRANDRDGRLAAAASDDTRHRDPIRRALGAELLARIGAASDLAAVDAVLRTDPDREARRVAARGLARRGDAEAAWLLIGALAAKALPEDRVLEQLGRPFAAETLVDALHLEQLRGVHAELVAGLGLARDAIGVFAVARLLRDGDERERTKACRALGRIGRTEVVPFLIEALEDTAATVRAIAARALGEIGDERCVPALGIHLTDRDWWVRANAAESLRRCGPQGILALERALESDDPFARDRAAEVLALHAAGQGAQAA